MTKVMNKFAHILFLLTILNSVYIQAETLRNGDYSSDGSLDIQPLSAIYSYAERSPVSIHIPGFSLVADTASLTHGIDIHVVKLPYRSVSSMPSNMENVCTLSDGIRLLPNGEHFSESQPALLSLAYDPKRIPMGYKAEDIYTFYSEDDGTWKRLERVSIDTIAHTVTSYTTHFTDFANAVITTPEMPEGKAFVPTDMQDLPDPDPLTGIPMIAVPQANNMGTAELTYPINLPPGRHGLQPDVDLHYSSAGGNGLLGVGWSIAQPAVTIDTRWGVPRYDLRYETEAYLINGEPFLLHDSADVPIPLPHMASSFESRRAQATRFYARDRRNQAKAVRHGQTPDRYWWSVTLTNGVTYYYGYDPFTQAIDESSVLRVDSGSIGYWALTYIVDRFDNYVHYTNYKYTDNEIVIQSIDYTGNHLQNLQPYYRVGFLYRWRNDHSSDARLGTLRNQNHLLCQIYVQLQGNDFINTYRLYYEAGSFSLHKSRLKSIAKIDGGLNPFGECGQPISSANLVLSDEHWIAAEDTVYSSITHENFSEEEKPGSLTQFSYRDAYEPDELFNNAQTLISSAANFSASRTEGWNIGGTATIGVGYNPAMTVFSAGANYSYSRNKGGVEAMMIDLNGDGLLDRLYTSNGQVYYQRQINSGSFAGAVIIQGLDVLSREVSNSHTFGVQLDFAANLSYNPVISDSYTDIYFTDVNGDGLPDLVTPEGVRINYLNGNNIPTFSPITDTVEGIEVQGNACSKSITFNGEVDERLMCTLTYRCVDTLMLSDLQPSDDGEAAFVEHPMIPDEPEPEAPGYYEPQQWHPLPIVEDGLAKSQMAEGDTLPRLDFTELYSNTSTTIPENSVKSWPSANWADILGGLYQGDDYTFKLVKDTIFVFQKVFSCEQKSDEPNVDIVRVWVSDRSGSLRIRSVASLIEDTTFSRIQARNADGVRLRIQWNKNVQQSGQRLVASSVQMLYDKIVAADDYSSDTVSYNIAVQPGDILFFRLSAKKSRRFDNVNWEQSICSSMGDTLFHSSRDYLCTGDRSFIAPASGTARMTLSCTNDAAEPVLLTAKLGNTQILNRTLPAHSTLDTVFQRSVADSSHISFFADSLSVEPQWSKVRIIPSVDYWGGLVVDTTGTISVLQDTLHYSPDVQIGHSSFYALDTCLHRSLFGPLHRGWGWFAYNDAGSVAVIPLHLLRNEERLMADSVNANSAAYRNDNAYQALNNPALSDSARMAIADSCFSAVPTYDPISADKHWVAMHADYVNNQYVAYGNTGVLGQRLHSVSRQIQEVADKSIVDSVIAEYDSPIPALHGDMQRITTVRKSSRSVQHGLSYGMSTPIGIGIAENVSFGTYDVTCDYMDMNGDGFPDFVGKEAIQYTRPWGGIGGLDGQLPATFSNSNSSAGLGFSASRPRPEHVPANGVSNSKMAFGGFGGGLSGQVGTDETHTHLVDINADGLPDIVDVDHNRVRYNLGYSFTDDWHTIPYLNVAASTHTDVSLSLSGNAHFEQIWDVVQLANGKTDYSLAQYSISGGYSSSTSQNRANTRLLDINGDGYPDLLTDNGTGNVRVRYYNGTSFGTEQTLNVQNMQTSSTANLGFNLGATAGFDLVAIPVKFCFGIQSSPWNVASSYGNTDFMDVNGDGYPDQIIANDNNLQVRYNKNGLKPVNLLTSVTNPTHQTITIDYALSEPSVNHRTRTWNMIHVEDVITPALDASSYHFYDFSYSDPFYDNFEKTDYGYSFVQTRDNHEKYLDEGYENRHYIKHREKHMDLLLNVEYRALIGHKHETQYYDSAHIWQADICDDIHLYAGADSYLTEYYETEASPQITARYEKIYDYKHNLIQYNDYGDVAINGDEWYQSITYKPTTSYNMISLPNYEQVTGGGGHVLRQQRAKYNQYGKPYQIIQDDIYRHVSAVTGLQYDAYGNIYMLRNPRNENNEFAWRRFIYDNDTKTHVTRVYNQFMEFHDYDYDMRFGLQTYAKDPAGNEMFWRYDRMGRLIDIVAPEEAAHNAPFTVHYIYRQPFHDLSQNAQQVWFFPHVTKVACACMELASVNTTIYDARGQAHQCKSWRFVNGQYRWVTDGWRVRDPWYRPYKTYDPYETDITTHPLWEPDNVSYHPFMTLYEYDALDRMTRCKHPDLTERLTSYYFATDAIMQTRLSTEVKDENAVTRRTLQSPQGWITETYNVADHSRTRYEHTPIGELLRVEDADGYVTRYDYDMFGNKVQRRHPDAICTLWNYAPDGSLVSTKTARMYDFVDSIHYTYCFGKLMNISYPYSPLNDVHYQYDIAGRMAYYEDGTGSTRLYYDCLGNVRLSLRRIVVPTENYTYTFRTRYMYDSFGRMRKLFYPDGETVQYDYYQSGELQAVIRHPNAGAPITVLDSMQYDEWGHNVYRTYGNMVTTYYQYEPFRNRLDQMQTISSYVPCNLQTLNYSYDGVGNITRIDQTVNHCLFFGGAYRNDYTYDVQNRLTRVMSSGPFHYDFIADYSPAGRMGHTLCSNSHVADENTVYGYDNNGWTHQPRVIHDRYNSRKTELIWDANGNLSQIRECKGPNVRYHDWDEENRLRMVVGNDYAGYYGYDANGDRVYKLSGASTIIDVTNHLSEAGVMIDTATLYPNPYVTIVPRGYTKHYYANGERLATVRGRGGWCNVSPDFISEHQSQHENDLWEYWRTRYANDFPFQFSKEELPPLTENVDIVNHPYDELQYRCSPYYLRRLTLDYHPNLLLQSMENNCQVYGMESVIFYSHPDHLRSACWITDKNGTPVQYLHYLPYGQLYANQIAMGYDERFKFTGKERDAETGYDYFGARYYWALFKHWTSTDPLLDNSLYISPYAYCNWNPIKYIDLDGRDPVKAAPDAIMGTPEYYRYREQQYQAFHNTTDPQAYYMSYGYKYATKFNNNSKNFSPKGQQWVQEVMINLQNAMKIRLNDQDGTDFELKSKDFQDFAFDSHVDAYWNEKGAVPFYDLEITDYWQIFQTIDFKDLVSPRGVKQEVKLGGRYVKYEAGKIQKAIIEYLQTLQQNINSLVSNEKQQ